MRKNYPLLSQELNDIFEDTYYKLVYIIGYDSEDGKPKFNGKFDIYEEQIKALIITIALQYLGDENFPIYKTWGKHNIRNELRSL